MDCYCCCVSLREASPGRGGRATRLHSRTVSHLVTCPQDPRSLGKGRAAAAPGRGLGPCELHPRVELPGAPAPASPRELPGKAELLVKGSRPCASRPTAPPAPGLGRTGPAQDPIPQAPGDKKPLRAYLFPMTFGDTAGRGAGDGGGGSVPGDGQVAPSCPTWRSRLPPEPAGPTEAHPHAQAPATLFSFP